MSCVCPISNGTQSIQRRAELARPVSIGATSCRCLIDAESKRRGSLTGLLPKPFVSTGEFQGWSFNAPLDVEFGASQLWIHSMDRVFNSSSFNLGGDPNIDFGMGFGGDDIGTHASLDNTNVDGGS